MKRTRKAGSVVYVPILVVVCALVLAGCKSGSTSDIQQSCRSEGGFLSGREITCTGSVGTAKGEPSVAIIDADGDLSGNYRLEATIKVGKGEAEAYIDTPDGGREGGRVSPGKPLRISAVVGLDDQDDEVSVNLKVLGKQIEDLGYQATVTPL